MTDIRAVNRLDDSDRFPGVVVYSRSSRGDEYIFTCRDHREIRESFVYGGDAVQFGRNHLLIEHEYSDVEHIDLHILTVEFDELFDEMVNRVQLVMDAGASAAAVVNAVLRIRNNGQAPHARIP